MLSEWLLIFYGLCNNDVLNHLADVYAIVAMVISQSEHQLRPLRVQSCALASCVCLPLPCQYVYSSKVFCLTLLEIVLME